MDDPNLDLFSPKKTQVSLEASFHNSCDKAVVLQQNIVGYLEEGKDSEKKFERYVENIQKEIINDLNVIKEKTEVLNNNLKKQMSQERENNEEDRISLIKQQQYHQKRVEDLRTKMKEKTEVNLNSNASGKENSELFNNIYQKYKELIENYEKKMSEVSEMNKIITKKNEDNLKKINGRLGEFRKELEKSRQNVERTRPKVFGDDPNEENLKRVFTLKIGEEKTNQIQNGTFQTNLKISNQRDSFTPTPIAQRVFQTPQQPAVIQQTNQPVSPEFTHQTPPDDFDTGGDYSLSDSSTHGRRSSYTHGGRKRKKRKKKKKRRKNLSSDDEDEDERYGKRKKRKRKRKKTERRRRNTGNSLYVCSSGEERNLKDGSSSSESGSDEGRKERHRGRRKKMKKEKKRKRNEITKGEIKTKRRTPKKRRKKNVRWDDSEEEALIKGICKYKRMGLWEEIRNDPKLEKKFDKERNGTALRDKYRNYCKKNEIPFPQQEFRGIPPLTDEHKKRYEKILNRKYKTDDDLSSSDSDESDDESISEFEEDDEIRLEEEENPTPTPKPNQEENQTGENSPYPSQQNPDASIFNFENNTQKE